jgi:hypothetical protein
LVKLLARRFSIKFKTGSVAGQSHSIGPGEYLFLGSSENCAIRISDDPTVSPTHACIFYDPLGVIRFKDMGSQFGTYKNGRKITAPIILRAGDRITLGQTTTFQSSWWNALQATSFTRFTMVKGPIGEELSGMPWFRRRAFKIGCLGLVLVICFFIALQPPSSESNGRTAERSRLVQKSSEKKGARDLGIFSGALSARLFSSTPKRASKPAVNMTPERQFIWDEIVAISRRFGDPPPSAMDPRFVQEVERHIRRFTRGNYHKVMLNRKAEFWPQIETILEAKGLPIELGYIVWIESSFQLNAVSPVGATGPWQFMPETAKEYGLRVGGQNDERRDLRRSTEAAADYFAGLLRMFGTERYLLAIASYNTGQNRVKRFQIASTVNKEKSSDFWHIRYRLPTETAEYVPKFMAAIIIGRNPERWDVGH